MAADLTPDELSRARKIAAMLSSDNAGETTNALALLKKIAAGHRLRVDALLAMLGDQSARPEPPDWARYTRPRRAHPEGGEYDFGDAIKREYERRQRAEKAEAYAKREQAEQERQRRQASADGSLKARLTMLGEIEEHRLSAWEQGFVQNVLMQAGRPFWRPSDKQSEVINRILEKYVGAA